MFSDKKQNKRMLDDYVFDMPEIGEISDICHNITFTQPEESLFLAQKPYRTLICLVQMA